MARNSLTGPMGSVLCLAALLLAATVAHPPVAYAQEADEPPDPDPVTPSIRAFHVSSPIHLDGVLDEEAWGRAQPATVFTQLDPDEGAPASQKTRAFVLYDDDALYIGAILEDTHPVSTRLGRRDGFLMDSDRFSVSLDSYNDHRTGFVFEVNPSGVRADQALTGGQDEHGDSSWDPVWEAATHIDENGWTAELRIPLSQLRFRSGDDSGWGIQFTRDIARNREKQLFSFTPKDEAGGIARFGHLVGLKGLQQSKGLELLPYVQGRAEYVQISQADGVAFKNPFRDGSDFFYGAGLDLKYRLSSNLTLDATLNPDFGQVEVDPAVVNLTAFETRYQEKRPFFVEGAGIFSFGEQGGGGRGGYGGGMGGMGGMGGGGGGGGGPTQLLYSRRIGDPPRGDTPDSAVYSDGPAATTILGAAKLTGQTAGGWAIGFMEAVTARETADYVGASLDRTYQAEVSPRSNYFVARLRKDFREGQSAIGWIGTAVNRELGDTTLAQELRSSAYTGGMDFFHEWADRAWSLSGYLAGSRIAGEPAVIESAQTSSARYYQRPDAHHVELDPGATSLSGYTANLELRRQAGLHWRGNVQFSTTSPGFEVNDLGYQRNADRRNVDGQLEYQENRPGDVFRRWQVSLSPRTGFNFDGDRLDTNVSVRTNLTFLNYWSLGGSYERGFESIDDRLTRGGPLALKPASHQISLNSSTDFSKPYTGRASARWEWDSAGREESSYSLNLGIKPSSTWELSLGPRLSINHAVAQYVGGVDDPLADATYGTRYLFAGLDQTTLSMETRLNVTFTPDLTLEIFAQPFIANGDYGTLKELRAPRTYDFLRYGVDGGEISTDADGDYVVDPDGPGPAEPFTVGNYDFNRVSLRGTGVLRWEWRPGSTLFLVWQQNRADYYDDGNFDFGRDAEAMFRARADNVFMVKATYWIGS